MRARVEAPEVRGIPRNENLVARTITQQHPIRLRSTSAAYRVTLATNNLKESNNVEQQLNFEGVASKDIAAPTAAW